MIGYRSRLERDLKRWEASGEAAIKGLSVDGKLQYGEPLF